MTVGGVEIVTTGDWKISNLPWWFGIYSFFHDYWVWAKRQGGWPFPSWPLIQAPQLERERDHVNRLALLHGNEKGEIYWRCVGRYHLYGCMLNSIYHMRIYRTVFVCNVVQSWAICTLVIPEVI